MGRKAAEPAKKGFKLDLRKFAPFSNRVVDDWNSLSSHHVNICTVNTFENIFRLNWNRKLLIYVGCVSFEIVGVMLPLDNNNNDDHDNVYGAVIMT